MDDTHLSVTATIQFNFEIPDDISISEILAEIEDRIRSGEYFPRDVVDVTIDTFNLIRKGA